MGEITLSDKTKIYDLESFEGLINKTRNNRKNSFLLSEIILFLLYSKQDKPIFGRTMIMKQIFLTIQEILDKKNISYQDPKFVPYSYGPYSFYVTDTLTHLNFMGLLEIKGKKNSKKESFMITEAGIKKIEGEFKKLPSNLQQEIVSRRMGWDQLGTDGILHYVYDYYPKYKERSKIKNRFKDIQWGKGRG